MSNTAPQPAPTGSNKQTESKPARSIETPKVKYEDSDPSVLEALILEEEHRLKSYQEAENDAFAALITASQERIKVLTDALLKAYRRFAEQLRNPAQPIETKPVITSNAQNNWERRVQQHVSTLKKFQGSSPEELTTFITETQQMYVVLVGDRDATSQRYFLEEIKLKLEATIQTRLQDSGGAATFNALVKWLRENYGEQHTSYQLLSKAWSAEYKPGTQFVNYSAAIERHMRTARDHIKSSWVKNNNGQQMTVDDAFELFSGMLMTEVVRKESFEVYQAMTSKLDSLTTAAKVAAEAETIRTQYGAKSLTSGEKTFYAPKSGSKQKSNDKVAKPKSPNMHERMTGLETAVAELTKVMQRIESKAKPNSNQPSGGKKSKKSKEKNSDDRSGSRNEGSQKKELGSAHHNENADESYMTETQLDCPDLSDSVIRSATDFH